MAKVANGPLTHPPSSSVLPGEDVNDGSQIAGFVSWARKFACGKGLFTVEHKTKHLVSDRP